MELDSSRMGDVLIVSVAGRVDWSGAQGFGLFLDDMIRRHGRGPIILDTSNLTHIGSGGIRALLIAARTQARCSARFAVCSPEKSSLRSLLSTTGLARALELHETREDALLAFDVGEKAIRSPGSGPLVAYPDSTPTTVRPKGRTEREQ
ncbi:MAG: STAS domain-containing protein [Gammaproteobacteria bacterium]|nr:STAS domain-containing protein [Gammaproteobacteria bacterium]